MFEYLPLLKHNSLRRVACSLSVFLFATIGIPACTDTNQPVVQETEDSPEEIKTVDETVTAAGDTVSTGSYAIVFPTNAVDDTVTVTLSGVEGHPENTLQIKGLENPPLAVSAVGGAIVDTVYVILPRGSAPIEQSVVAFETDGLWAPLAVVAETATKTVVAVPPSVWISERDPGSPTEVRGGFFQIEYAAVETRLERRSPERNLGPAVVLIHGICSDSGTWDDELVGALFSDVGEVWELNYDWKVSFWNVQPAATQEIKSKLGDRSVYILAHSKGGLLARSIMRFAENNDLMIEKVAFFGTPHYGVSALTLALAVYDLLCPELILNPVWPGWAELYEESSSLDDLNQSHVFAKAPRYLNVVGACLPQVAGDCLFSDLFVCVGSADLASHTSGREQAIFEPTVSVDYGCGHTQLHKYSPERWADIRDFLVSPSECVLDIAAPTGDPPPWYVGSTEHIQWISGGTSGNVKLELYRNGAFQCVIEESTADDGDHPWTVAACGGPSSWTYQIKITDVDDVSCYDFSENFGIDFP